MYRNYPTEEFRDVLELVRQASLRFSEKPIFQEERDGCLQTTTYGELIADVNALGTEIYAQSNPGDECRSGDTGVVLRLCHADRVLLVGDPSAAWVTAYLAVAGGGGTVVPMDSHASVAELARAAARTSARAIFCPRAVKNELKKALAEEFCAHVMQKETSSEPSGAAEVLTPTVWALEELPALERRGRERIERGDRAFLETPPEPSAPCTILFESGVAANGGRGVMLSHRNLCFTVAELCRMVELTADDSFLSVLPLHFIYSFLCGILVPLSLGCTVTFSKDLRRLAQEMRRSKPTVVVCSALIPEAMHRKIRTRLQENNLEKRFSAIVKATNGIPSDGLRDTSKRHALAAIHESFGGNLRLLLACGGTVSSETLTGLRGFGIHTLEAYGLPECSSLLSINRDRFFRDGTAGHPLPNTILDIYGMQEDGVGEIRCKGDHVMLGYLEAPDATADVLRDGWLYTGMFGSFDPDGFLRVVGKKQTIIRTANGKPVFPEELEALLLKSPYVRKALVKGILNPDRQDYDVSALLTPNLDRFRQTYGEHFTEAQVRAELRRAVEDVNSQTPPHKRIRAFRIG